MKFLKRFNLNIKILIIVALSSIMCAATSTFVAVYFANIDLKAGIQEKAYTVHSRLEAATEFVALQGGLLPIIERLKTKYKSDSELSEAEKLDVLKQVPIFAAMKIGAKDAEKEGYKFRVFSDEPRKKENLASEFEMTIFNKFKNDESLKHYVHDDGVNVTVYKPVRLKESQGCISCHGDPSTSPWGNGKDILGYKMENWKDGKLHGVFSIEANVAAISELRHSSEHRNKIIMYGLIPIVFAMFFSYYLMKSPLQNLKMVAENLSSVTSNVTETSTKMSNNSSGLSQATIEQTASLQETAASLEEVGAMIKKTSDNAISTSEASAKSRQKAEVGNEIVLKMIHSMEEINNSNENIRNEMNKSNQEFAEIVNLIHEIGNKTKIINDIVFQTKLLSFNASVEAARAGDHGKGFAVVAEEVGNLASMSGGAATEISQMLSESIKTVERIVGETKVRVDKLMLEGKEKVDFGSAVAKECGEILNQIVDNVKIASEMAVEISNASAEQSQGIAEISKAMAQLDAVTQDNSQTSQELSQVADILNTDANTLENSVIELLNTINGEKS